MPDLERILRDLELDLSTNKEYVKGYHAGKDVARKEIAICALILFVVTYILLFLLL